jgi:hypothetical protein
MEANEESKANEEVVIEINEYNLSNNMLVSEMEERK